ncbi:MAG TPA: hypothetical protein V6D11_09300 [Waterburya sp.]|jgi:hypothetical protein
MVSASVFRQLTTQHPLVLTLEQNLVSLPKETSCERFDQFSKSARKLSYSQAQELICQFFLDGLEQYSPESILQRFKYLWIEPTQALNSTPRQALELILSSGSEQTFINTLKRSIYILVNNWSTARQQNYVQQLLQLLSTFPNVQKTSPVTLKRLMLWRRNFVNSQDYQELKLFTSKYENRHQEHWSQRYSSYLLVSQSVDVKKPLEQQEAARTYSKELKERFQFELAMYTARSSAVTCPDNTSPNPTYLGDGVLRLIQKILKKRGRFSYASLARIFLNQTQRIRYKDFKQNLLNYLLFSSDDPGLAEIIKSQLTSPLNTLYQSYHDQTWDDDLLLRTAKRLIEYFTTIDKKHPSRLFILLMAQGKSLHLAIILLKIVLLCPQSHTHLECCLAQLVQHYKNKPEVECQWLIDFLEVIQLTLTIYVEDVRYNLVKMQDHQPQAVGNAEGDIYRIFSQFKRGAKKYQRAA